MFFFPLDIVVFLFFVAFSKSILLKKKLTGTKNGRSEPRFGETFYVKINKDAVANKSEDVALGLMLKEAGAKWADQLPPTMLSWGFPLYLYRFWQTNTSINMCVRKTDVWYKSKKPKIRIWTWKNCWLILKRVVGFKWFNKHIKSEVCVSDFRRKTKNRFLIVWPWVCWLQAHCNFYGSCVFVHSIKSSVCIYNRYSVDRGKLLEGNFKYHSEILPCHKRIFTNQINKSWCREARQQW